MGLALRFGSIAVRTVGGAPTGTPDPFPGIEPQRRILIVGAPAPGANGGLALRFGLIAGRTVGVAATGAPDPIPGIEPQRRIVIVWAPAPGANRGARLCPLFTPSVAVSSAGDIALRLRRSNV